ncbi:uncharacterized protein [Zea mays]|uniref:SAP domain-containing protein n=1 Tax=Zea mays TaxID=4577 RepID=A0A1D6IKA9_MAIZE|nr:uncharacterized protein LOC100502129 isoform X2 [Zea mays]XP_035817044.1 uncharacterized protein LOC100502129 isoform X2 [Zea mays]ONM59844.1 SAP domain-containing protein [Zea mays]
MLTYPILNDRSIDQWTVTELKDELERRYLPVSGSKDELLKRLFEAMQDEILDGEGKTTVVTSPPEELKGGETPGSIDVSVNQASIEQHVHKGASEVAKQGVGLVISVTEAYDESTFATSEVTQEAVVGTAEVSQRSLDAVAEVESCLVDAAATDEPDGNGQGSASSGDTIVKEGSPRSEGHGNTIEKTPEDGTNKKIAVDDEPSDLTGGDIKLGLDVHSKILKLEDEPAPPHDMLHNHEDSDVVAVAEPEDDTSKKMISDDVPTGLMHTNVELGAKVDCKIEQEEVSTLSDAAALHSYPKEHIVAVAKGLALPRRMLMSGYTSNIDLDRKEESPDINSCEKLNLNRSSGDESMDEDVMERKHADSYIKPEDLRGKTKVTSEHVFKDVSLLDTRAEGSPAHSKEVVTEEKLSTPTEKRKLEDQEVIENNEPIKRQYLWNEDAVNISDQQASKITSTGTQKEVICPAPERSFGRPNTVARRNSPKERIVPPAKTSATTSLRIDRFVRPFTLKAVKELLGKTGSICSFWMDEIKTHCYVTYSSVEEAVATRNAVYDLQWPSNNNNYLIAEFVDPEEYLPMFLLLREVYCPLQHGLPRCLPPLTLDQQGRAFLPLH